MACSGRERDGPSDREPCAWREGGREGGREGIDQCMKRCFPPLCGETSAGSWLAGSTRSARRTRTLCSPECNERTLVSCVCSYQQQVEGAVLCKVSGDHLHAWFPRWTNRESRKHFIRYVGTAASCFGLQNRASNDPSFYQVLQTV